MSLRPSEHSINVTCGGIMLAARTSALTNHDDGVKNGIATKKQPPLVRVCQIEVIIVRKSHFEMIRLC